MDQLEEILERMRNHSTNSCRNAETPESSRDSDVCPICNGDEWILVKKDGIERAVPCKCRERAVMSRRLRFADIPEAFRGMDLKTFRMDVYRNLIGTLLAHSSSTPPIIMASSQANAEIGIGYCPTITAAAGMAGNNQPILFDNHGPDTRYSGPVKVAQTITSALGTGGNNTPLAVHGEPYCIAGNVINRQDKNGGNGCGYQQGVSYTLTTEDRHCVAYTDDLQRKKRVRKLIPLECERLMGFPDHWTDIPGASDSVRYRALGNSVAVPCVEYILCGIAYFLERQEGERDVHIPG